MASNGISTLSTKQAKQIAKLDLAQTKRQAGGNVQLPYYRTLNEYDITELPTQYSGNVIVDNLNEEGLVQGRPWVTFLPKDLFAAGEQGVYFDASDITTLFQDVAGTVPVTSVGQSVALIKDKSGRNNHASQATASYRPTWQIDPYGYGYLSFDGVNDYLATNNINLTSTAQVTASVGLFVEPNNYVLGFTKTTYSGYHNEVTTYTDLTAISSTTSTSSINITSESSTTTELYLGYILADYTGTWTFSLTSDDGSYLWIGNTAISGYTTSNTLINNGGLHGSATVSATINLTAGQYYPIRVLYGNSPSAGVLSLTYAHTGQSATYDYTGKAFRNSPGAAISTGGDPNSVNGTFLIGAPGSISDHSFYLRGTSTIIARIPNQVVGDDIMTGVFDLSQATKELELIPRLSGVVETANVSWYGTTAGTGNFANLPLYIGSLGGSSTFFKGHIYNVVVRGALSTGTQITNTETWINRKLN
jgi:hypothetical protein